MLTISGLKWNIYNHIYTTNSNYHVSLFLYLLLLKTGMTSWIQLDYYYYKPSVSINVLYKLMLGLEALLVLLIQFLTPTPKKKKEASCVLKLNRKNSLFFFLNI